MLFQGYKVDNSQTTIMKYYLKSSILEAIERAKKLKTKYPNGLNIYFQKLAESSLIKIDEVILDLNYYLEDARYQTESNQKHRLKELKKLIRVLDILENVVVAAINRHDEIDDVRVNVLVQKICKEINYPLIPPTVTCLSQEYYRIFPSFNLLCVPLLECDFLLHLPDLYHELGHPLIDLEDNPKIEKFQQELGNFSFYARAHFEKLIENDKRNNNKAFVDLYETWQSYWQNWSIEFFCDLFGVCTLGPAYAWAHFHLSAKQGQNPFHVKKSGSHSSHPNDEARMQVICCALDLLGFSREKKAVLEKWNALHTIIPYEADDAFELAYPRELLELCATHGINAVKGIGCVIASASNNGVIYSMLNEAWKKFWENSEDYFTWEAEELKKLH